MKTALVSNAHAGEPSRLEALPPQTSGLDGSLRSQRLCLAARRHRRARERLPRALRPGRFSNGAARFTTARAPGSRVSALRPPLFALAREASRRVLGQRPFDEQLIAALALDDGTGDRDADGRGEDADRRDAGGAQRPCRSRRARPDVQRLSGTPRRRVDGAGLSIARALRRLRPAGDGAAREARRLQR